jgi:hypothetical protein
MVRSSVPFGSVASHVADMGRATVGWFGGAPAKEKGPHKTTIRDHLDRDSDESEEDEEEAEDTGGISTADFAKKLSRPTATPKTNGAITKTKSDSVPDSGTSSAETESGSDGEETASETSESDRVEATGESNLSAVSKSASATSSGGESDSDREGSDEGENDNGRNNKPADDSDSEDEDVVAKDDGKGQEAVKTPQIAVENAMPTVKVAKAKAKEPEIARKQSSESVDSDVEMREKPGEKRDKYAS